MKVQRRSSSTPICEAGAERRRPGTGPGSAWSSDAEGGQQRAIIPHVPGRHGGSQSFGRPVGLPHYPVALSQLEDQVGGEKGNPAPQVTPFGVDRVVKKAALGGIAGGRVAAGLVARPLRHQAVRVAAGDGAEGHVVGVATAHGRELVQGSQGLFHLGGATRQAGQQ